MLGLWDEILDRTLGNKPCLCVPQVANWFSVVVKC